MPNLCSDRNAPPTTVVNTVGVGLKNMTLCRGCIHFKPKQPNNCPIAQQLFEFSNKFHIGTIAVRCANFSPLPGVHLSNSRGIGDDL